MSEKKSFLNWVGFSGEETATPGSVDRIRELETQLADLRSRRDITALSKEEFEILATETAMSMIKSAQLREARAQAASDRLVNETSRAAKDALEAAQNKAASMLSGAESRGRKYIQAAESEAQEIKSVKLLRWHKPLAVKVNVLFLAPLLKSLITDIGYLELFQKPSVYTEFKLNH